MKLRCPVPVSRALARFVGAPLVITLCCFSAAWIGDVWYATFRQGEAARERALADAARDAASLARVIEEHSARTIQSADQAVQFMRYEYLEMGMGLDLRRLLHTGTILGDIFNLYSIVDADGRLALSSGPFQPVDLSDREHIRVHMEGRSRGLYVSKPVLGRISGKWSIQLTRRIERQDGSFGGVAVVSMDPFYFIRLYEAAQVSPNSVTMLVGADGVVRARRIANSDELGQDLGGSELLRAIGARNEGVLRARSVIDGRERIYAFRRLDAYQLLAVVGIDVGDVLGPLETARVHAFHQATLSTAAILLFTAVLLVLVRRVLRSRAQALSANAAKTQFLSHMSHELRTPLNGILGYAELLAEELDDGEQRESARIILSSGQHLLALVNQLLQLNRIEAGRDNVVLADEDIRALVEQAVSLHRASARLKGLELGAWVSPLIPERVACDRTKLLQVLNNLLHNAVKFTDSGRIELSLAPAGDNLAFAVTDTGRGIPPALQERVFERFFQVDSGDARAGDGTGLGLALVRELVGLMGGRVHLSSARGVGSAFHFTLPRLAPAGLAKEAA